MFENLPLRSEIQDTDYITSYREDALLTDGITPWSVVKNNLLNGLMIKNKYYKIFQEVNVSTSKTNITIKDLNNDLITFEDVSHGFMGLFQIYCYKYAPSHLNSTLKNILCLYDLKWVPKNLEGFTLVGGTRVLPINYYADGSGVDIADEINLPKSYQHIFIPPFNPLTTAGHFSLEIQFTSSISEIGVGAGVNADIWITETK